MSLKIQQQKKSNTNSIVDTIKENFNRAVDCLGNQKQSDIQAIQYNN